MPESERVLRFTQELIRLPSYSGNERVAADYVFTTLSEHGGQPFIQGGDVILRLEGTNKQKAFLFNGHLDVVDIGDRNRWQHDPWGGQIVGDRIYGRGTSDMKGGVAAMMD